MVRTDVVRFTIRRLVLFVPVWFGISFIAFSMIHLTPGSPINALLPEGARNPENIARIKAQWGLDQPFHMQYIDWLWRALHGDLGFGFTSGAPVTNQIATAVVPTAQLGLLVIVFTMVIAFPLGIIGAVKKGTWVDQLTRLSAFGGASIPQFWIGIMLILIFAAYWNQWYGYGLIPTGGYVPLDEGFFPWLRHLIAPALCIAIGFSGITLRMVRGAMIEEMNKQYVQTARSKGLKEYSVIVSHVFRNALIPVVTVIGMQIGFVMNGSIVIEQVFAIPGIGRLLFWSTINQDIPVVTGVLLFIGSIYLFANLSVDILYAYLDPRIEQE